MKTILDQTVETSGVINIWVVLLILLAIALIGALVYFSNRSEETETPE